MERIDTRSKTTMKAALLALALAAVAAIFFHASPGRPRFAGSMARRSKTRSVRSAATASST